MTNIFGNGEDVRIYDSYSKVDRRKIVYCRHYCSKKQNYANLYLKTRFQDYKMVEKVSKLENILLDDHNFMN